MILPTDGYVSAWRRNAIFDIWRYRFSPNCSMYATVSLPPVPVVQPLFFQHLSASALLTFFSERPSPASAMLRDVGFFGRSVALKSVFLSVDAFAAYTSPKPCPVLMAPLAGAACARAVRPLLVETNASIAASTRSANRPIANARFFDTADSLRPSIVPPLMSVPRSVVWFTSRQGRRTSRTSAARGRGGTRSGHRKPASRR